MADKVTYELKANVSAVAVQLPGGKHLSLQQGESFSTKDTFEIQTLDGVDGLKRGDTAAKTSDSKGGKGE